MSEGRSSLPPTRANSRQNRSNSFPENDNLQPPTKTNRGRRSFDTKASKPEQDSLEDGKILVLKVIGKVNLRIERKEYQELTRILNQIPGDVLVLILDNLSMESLYADIPSSLASLAALYSKIFYDRQGKLPDHGFSSDDFVHRLVRYFVDVLKYNNQTFASARSREHIKTIFKVCAQIDNSLHERIVQRVEQLSKALKGFSEHSLLETITRSSATRYMRMPEALKSELERAINHYKSSLQRLADILLRMPDNHGELDLSSSAHSKVDIDEKTIQYMRKLSRKTIEDRLSFNQNLLSAVQDSSRDKLLINELIDSLGTRINHDKEVRAIFFTRKIKNNNNNNNRTCNKYS